jgi:site-specific recombinase XerD
LAGSEPTFLTEVDAWLSSLSSPHTRKTYRRNIDLFFDYCKQRDTLPLFIGIKQVREFITHLRSIGKTTPSIRGAVAANARMFDTIFENHDIERRNPFSGKDLLPKKERLKQLNVPSETEVEKLIAAAKKQKDKTVFVTLSLVTKFGLRVGAFENAELRGNKLTTTTKGKPFHVVFDQTDIDLWNLAKPALNTFTAKNLDDRVSRFLLRAYKLGIVNERFSVHKFRHFFACETYKKTKDIMAVSVALNHGNVATTDGYFTSLKQQSNVEI